MVDATTGGAGRISELYAALDRGDHAAMAALYAPDATFTDPAFGRLEGEQVTAMWRMLCERATDLDVVASDIRAGGDEGSAHWDATYTFGATGRKVVNRIDARFRFRDGLIVEHVDSFSFWRWSSQALGPLGRALGWTPLLHAVFRRGARRQLAAFQAERRTA